MLISAWWVSNVHATGTGGIEEISAGVVEMSNTMRGADILENIAIVVLGILGLGLLSGHLNGGFVTVFTGLIALGLWFGAESAIAAIPGWQAVSM